MNMGPLNYRSSAVSVSLLIIFDHLITFKALSGLALRYIIDLLDVHVPKQNLRSCSNRKLVAGTYNLETYVL